ncbi:MAG: hypothetical protein AABX65_02950 [Nanoarchaeota archaeon]
MKKREALIIIILLVILVALVLLAYFKFSSSQACENEACFNSALEGCKKTIYNANTPEALWRYTIKKKTANECLINVEFIEAKQGKVELQALQGKEMLCALPIGIVASPQADLKNCHGRLKEDIQELIIQKTHTYITDNWDKISSALPVEASAANSTTSVSAQDNSTQQNKTK